MIKLTVYADKVNEPAENISLIIIESEKGNPCPPYSVGAKKLNHFSLANLLNATL